MAHTRPIPCQFDKWNCQIFINIKKYKIAFRMGKDHLRTIFFLMTLLDLCFNQFTSMQGLETNIYENPKIKDFINPSCPKHPKVII